MGRTRSFWDRGVSLRSVMGFGYPVSLAITTLRRFVDRRRSRHFPRRVTLRTAAGAETNAREMPSNLGYHCSRWSSQGFKISR